MTATPPTVNGFVEWPAHQSRCARCLRIPNFPCADGGAIFALESEVLRVRADLDPPAAPTTAAGAT